MSDSRVVSAVTVRLNQRETDCLDIVLDNLKETFRQADIERNGFVTADPNTFVTKTLALRHAIVHMAGQLENVSEPA